MAYLKINGVDYSMYVSGLKVITNSNYNAQLNAAGDTVVDYINQKRTIEVNIIALDAAIMPQLKTAIDGFSISLSFRNPTTNQLEENVNCIIPSNEVSYYTIQSDRVLYQALTLSFTEL